MYFLFIFFTFFFQWVWLRVIRPIYKRARRPIRRVYRRNVTDRRFHGPLKKDLEAVNETLGNMNTRLENVEKMEGRLAKLEAAKTEPEAAKTVPAKTGCHCAVA